MVPKLLGISIYFWGAASLVLAVLYAFTWPRPRPEAPPRPAWAQFVLRYLHSLVWALLAGACFLWGSGSGMLAYIFARLAVIGYMIYIGALALDRRGKFG
ncbi:MAG: hypothetical protein MUC85_04725 [Anaerolineales bacterium]|jgi:hypothetical protein|nr:hypothetical protein [Anaerolineales bacterium]